jgi:hypothetical protein
VTPLMIALDNDHNDVAQLLMSHGADPSVSDWWGRTALYIAIDRKEAAGGGGRGGAPGGGGGRGGRGGTASVAARASGPRISSMDIITALLAAGVDPNPQLNMHRPSRGGNSGRFADNQLSTGCTPLFRAAQSNDAEVMRSHLANGANPNINAMGLTPFQLAAGLKPRGRGGGGGAPNTAILDLMIEHGADVNAQVTGTRTYSMRISYHPPPDKEGASALHEAVQAGRTDLVRYLLDKGANPELVDGNGHKPIDLVAAGASGRGNAQVPPAATGNAAAAGATAQLAVAPPAAGAGGRGGGSVSAASAAEIRALLQNVAPRQ